MTDQEGILDGDKRLIAEIDAGELENLIETAVVHGGMLAKEADLTITISSSSTARIQECHIAVGHLFCELTEEALASGRTEDKTSNLAE